MSRQPFIFVYASENDRKSKQTKCCQNKDCHADRCMEYACRDYCVQIICDRNYRLFSQQEGFGIANGYSGIIQLKARRVILTDFGDRDG